MSGCLLGGNYRSSIELAGGPLAIIPGHSREVLMAADVVASVSESTRVLFCNNRSSDLFVFVLELP